MLTAMEPDGRTRHYGTFYGLNEPDDRPLWLVHGNCQAEALRVMLDSVADAPFTTVRMPPVHELSASDVPHLDRLLARAAVVLSQPVRDGYRDLPLGTDEVRSRTSGATVIRWPVFRYSGLYPFQVIVRHPSEPSATPAAVPYHDLRTLLAASRGADPDAPWDVEVDASGIRANADASVAELARREGRDCDVVISDVIRDHGAAACHTINHPGNGVLHDLAVRILAAAETPGAPSDPGRVLLNAVHTPLDARVIDALALDSAPRTEWTVGDTGVSTDEVHRTQMRWYAEHPEFVGAGLERHAATLELLGAAS